MTRWKHACVSQTRIQSATPHSNAGLIHLPHRLNKRLLTLRAFVVLLCDLDQLTEDRPALAVLERRQRRAGLCQVCRQWLPFD